VSGVVFARKPKHMHSAARAKRPVMRPEARPAGLAWNPCGSSRGGPCAGSFGRALSLDSGPTLGGLCNPGQADKGREACPGPAPGARSGARALAVAPARKASTVARLLHFGPRIAR
jgi:hypothetical protein